MAGMPAGEAGAGGGDFSDMDARLVAWARAVKARRRAAGLVDLPVLWLLTDAGRLPDPRGTVARLPPGLAGVVLRHESAPDRRQLAADLARLCRARRLRLAVAGDWRLAAAVGAGLHLRAGHRPAAAPCRMRAWTSSAHGVAELVRARRAGAVLALLSPVFPTRSHPGATPLGPVRWGLMARRGAGALGGVTGGNIRRLAPRLCHAAGAIDALL
jgi:thiamine-phosphate pyrophosphorylase